MEEKTFKEKVQIIIENYNKFIGIKLELEERTDLKVHDVSYLCYDREKLIKMLQEKFKERKEDVIKIVNEKNMDNVFSFYCDCRFNDFENDLDELGVNFRDVVRIGRTSSFYMINKSLYNIEYNHNDLIMCLWEMGLDTEEKIETISIKTIKNLLGYNSSEAIRENIDMYLSDSESLLEEIEPWKKAKEYLDNFKEHQEEDFVQFFYYNELNEELWELEKERQREYEEKVSKAIRVRTAHRRKRNEKIIVKIY
jgi:hypothetical protein